jgi:predicted transcriptional regulator
MIAAMLEAAAEESKPTEIMYRAYMSYEQFKEYLALVTARKLVEYNSTRKTYKLTPTGKEFLAKCEKLKL